jgi:hypothetical protein
MEWLYKQLKEICGNMEYKKYIWVTLTFNCCGWLWAIDLASIACFFFTIFLVICTKRKLNFVIGAHN